MATSTATRSTFASAIQDFDGNGYDGILLRDHKSGLPVCCLENGSVVTHAEVGFLPKPWCVATRGELAIRL